jgi:hypothetical protein
MDHELVSGCPRVPEKPGELLRAKQSESFADIGLHRVCGSAHLIAQSEISAKRAGGSDFNQ